MRLIGTALRAGLTTDGAQRSMLALLRQALSGKLVRHEWEAAAVASDPEIMAAYHTVYAKLQNGGFLSGAKLQPPPELATPALQAEPPVEPASSAISLFEEIDSSGDGDQRLSQHELDQWLTSSLGTIPTAVAPYFHRADTSNDGFVTSREFAASQPLATAIRRIADMARSTQMRMRGVELRQ